MTAPSVARRAAILATLATLALGAVHCGPPGPGPFQGMYPNSTTLLTTMPGSAGQPVTGLVTITGSTDPMVDLLVTFPIAGGSCTLHATRSGTMATFAPGQTCMPSGTGFSYTGTVTTGTATISGTALIMTLTGTFSGTVLAIPVSGTFTFAANGMKQ